MTRKQVSVRLVAEGGQIVRAEFDGVSAAQQKMVRQIVSGNKSAADSAAVFAAALDAEERAFEAVRASVDPAWAAQRRYEGQVEAVEQAVRRGIMTQEEAARTLSMARSQTLLMADASQDAAAGLGVLGGHTTRMVSMQLSQVAQQTMASGDAMRALAIQAPDIGLAFGTVGIAAGVLAGVLLPVIGNLFKTGEASKSAEDALNDFVGQIDRFRAAADIASSSVQDLREEYGKWADEIQRGARLQAQVNLAMGQQALRDAVDGISEGLADAVAYSRQAIEAGNALRDAQAALFNARVGWGQAGGLGAQNVEDLQNDYLLLTQMAEAAADSIGLTRAEATQLNTVLQDLATANGMDEVAQRASDALDTIQSMFPATAEIPPEIAKIVDGLREVQEAAALGSIAAESIRDASEGIGPALNAAAASASVLSGNLQSAATNAWSVVRGLAAAMWQQGQNRLAARDAIPLDNLAEQYRLYGMGRAAFDAANREARYTPEAQYPGLDWDAIRNPAAGGGGGGGGGADREAERAFQERMRDAERWIERTRTATERYNEELADLAELNELGFFAEAPEAYARAVEMVREQFRDAEFGDMMRQVQRITDQVGRATSEARSWAEAWDNLGDVFENTLRRMAADLMSSGLREQIMGTFFPQGGTAGGGGFLGRILGGLFGAGAPAAPVESYMGGGYTGAGARSGGLDGRGGFLAMLHPDETVVDHRRGRGSGRVEIVIRQEPGTVAEIARNEAGALIGRYDQAMPARVAALTADPRRR